MDYDGNEHTGWDGPHAFDDGEAPSPQSLQQQLRQTSRARADTEKRLAKAQLSQGDHTLRATLYNLLALSTPAERIAHIQTSLAMYQRSEAELLERLAELEQAKKPQQRASPSGGRSRGRRRRNRKASSATP